ncbi:MAG: methyl-accepting chemotaxis protein [Candidatus Electrothrix sp. YB6]
MAHPSEKSEKPKKDKKKNRVDIKRIFTGQRSIRGRLLFWLLIISLVPMAGMALVSYKYSSTALRRQSFEQLETTLAFQHQALQRYFDEQAKKLENIAGNMQILQEQAYTKLTAVRALQKKQITTYFRMRFEDVQMFGDSPQQQQALAGLLDNAAAFAPFAPSVPESGSLPEEAVSEPAEAAQESEFDDLSEEASAEVLQEADNPAEHSEISQDSQESGWLPKNAAAAPAPEFVEFLENWLRNRDFVSLTMLSPDGTVAYSTDRNVERGAQVQEGTAEREGLEKGMQETRFIDYGASSFHEENYIAYFATPLLHDGVPAGVLLFRLDNHALDEIMKDTTGLGETGESYMVGMDGMFRSNSRHFEEATVANPSFLVDNESIVEAFAGEDGEEITVNYRGDYVLSAYTRVTIYGTTWVLMVEVDQSEAVVPKVEKKAAPKEGEIAEETDYLSQLVDMYKFPDFYLVSPDGYVFASAREKKDYLTNILDGPYADSMFGRTVTEVLKNGEMAVSDYAFYEPVGGQAAAFMGMPVKDRGEIAMIAVLQISIDPINQIMDVRRQFEEAAGHGALGEHAEMIHVETYLVGPDKLWRSEAKDVQKYKVKSTLLEPKAKVDTEATREALAGKSDTRIIVNSIGEEVLSSWAQVQFKGLNWAVIGEVPREEVDQPVMGLLWTVGLLALLAAAAIAVVSVLVARGVTGQVGEIMQVMEKVEQGEYGEQVKVTSSDELGQMAASFNRMTTTIQELIESRQKEHDALQDSIIQLLEEITNLAEGDLSIRATVTEDVIGTVADSLNLMLEELGTAFARIKQSSEQVGSTANILSASTGELADKNNNQASMINEAVQEINLLTNAIRDAADKADQSSRSSKESSQVAEEGAQAVRETSQSMEAIRSNVQNTARAIKRLGESSQEISDFARTINEISDRTSILALNASIQAAAAGEEGRGFAVVAEEIQRLAERAAVSTRQIETLIKNILGEITEAGVSMDASIQEVVQGTKLSQNALSRLEEITERSNQVSELIQGVALAAQQQAETTAVLATSMGEIGAISLETAEEAMGASVSMQEMAGMGEDMLQAVATFKLEAEQKADDAVDDALKGA